MATKIGAGQFTIVDVNDGISIQLSSYSQTVSTASDGSGGDYTNCKFNISVFLGQINDTASWNITASVSSGVIGSLTNRTYTITNLTSQEGYVDITASRYGFANLSARYIISKVQKGSNPIVAQLSNENHTFTSDSNGVIAFYTGSGSDIRVYEGTTQLTYDGIGTTNGKWKITTNGDQITPSSTISTIVDGTSAYANVASHSNMIADIASIQYTITGKSITGVSFTITKQQSFSKAKMGNGATTYWLTSGTSSIKKDVFGVYSPSSVIVSLMQVVGNNTPSLFSGKFVVATYDGISYTNRYTSSTIENTIIYTPPVDIKSIRIRAYTTVNSVEILLYEMEISIVVDGSSVVPTMSNEVITVQAEYDGSVQTNAYAGTGFSIKVNEGPILLTPSSTLTNKTFDVGTITVTSYYMIGAEEIVKLTDSVGQQNISIAKGGKLDLDGSLGTNTFILEGWNIDDFIVYRNGQECLFYDKLDNTLMLSIPATTVNQTFIFNNGTKTLLLDTNLTNVYYGESIILPLPTIQTEDYGLVDELTTLPQDDYGLVDDLPSVPEENYGLIEYSTSFTSYTKRDAIILTGSNLFTVGAKTYNTNDITFGNCYGFPKYFDRVVLSIPITVKTTAGDTLSFTKYQTLTKAKKGSSATITSDTIASVLSYTPNILSLTNTSPSLSPSTGALVVSGGVGIAKTLNVGNDVAALSFTITDINGVPKFRLFYNDQTDSLDMINV